MRAGSRSCGGDTIEVYDSDDDAMETAAYRYGYGPYLIQPINPDDVTHLAPYFLPRVGEMRA